MHSVIVNVLMIVLLLLCDLLHHLLFGSFQPFSDLMLLLLEQEGHPVCKMYWCINIQKFTLCGSQHKSGESGWLNNNWTNYLFVSE